jgi:hypothetical protein
LGACTRHSSALRFVPLPQALLHGIELQGRRSDHPHGQVAVELQVFRCAGFPAKVTLTSSSSTHPALSVPLANLSSTPSLSALST